MTKETNEQQIVYLAALLHDIGKFIERARRGNNLKKSIFGNEEIRKLKVGGHPAYSAWFLKTILQVDYRNATVAIARDHHWGSNINDPFFINKKIIKIADGLSASERLLFEEEEELKNESLFVDESYYLTRLISIFSKIYSKEEFLEHQFRYWEIEKIHLGKNSIETFSVQRENDVDEKKDKEIRRKSVDKYADLIENEFWKEVNQTFDINKNSYALLEKYTSKIPAQTPRNRSETNDNKKGFYPDISLFDHSRSVAAIAICLQKQIQTDTTLADYVKRYSFSNGKISPSDFAEYKSIYLLQGDFSGIQSFIFDVDGKGAAKALKGRSMYIQLLSEVVCKYLIRELGLEEANIIYNGGGNFYILIPECLKDEAEKCQTHISKVLYQAHKGELYLAMGFTPLKMNEFSNFADKWYNSRRVVVQNKVNRWAELKDEKLSIFEPFNSDEKKHETLFYESFQTLTGSLRNAQYLCFHEVESKFDSTRFHNEITYSYQDVFHALGYHVCFHTNEIPEQCEATYSYKLNDTDFGKCDGFRFMVHKLPKEKDFSNIAQYAKGDKKLGLLKMDIDNLGEIFRDGLGKEDRSISRVATLSRNIHLFFEGYMNTILGKVGLTEDEEQTIYPVYAGGDDLLFIGPYDVMLDAAKIIREDFKNFVANNDKINLSAALLIMDDKFPMKEAARRVDKDLKKAKRKEKKNAICMMGEVFSWEEFGEMDAMSKMLINMIESKDLNKKESRSLIQKIKNSTRGFDKIMQNAEKGKIDFEKLWRFKYYLRDMKSANDFEKEKLIEWYDNLILNQTIEKNGNKKYNPMVLPVACRIAELKTKN